MTASGGSAWRERTGTRGPTRTRGGTRRVGVEKPADEKRPDHTQTQAQPEALIARLGDALDRRQAVVLRLEALAVWAGAPHAALATELARLTAEVDGLLAELRALVTPAEAGERGEPGKRTPGASGAS
jgi:hypothetical protein